MAGASGVYCSVCGHYNVAGRAICEHCGSQLPELKRKAKEYVEAAEAGKRPGCVTAYAILAVIGSLFIILTLLTSSSNSMLRDYLTPGTMALQVVLVIVSLAAAYGVWNMKNWGRLLVIAQNLLGLSSYVISILTGSVGGMMAVDTMTLITLLISGVIIAYITYWFYSHRELFE